MAEPKEPRRRATYQDVIDAPEHMVAEILDGELVLSPRPAAPHTMVHSTLMADLGSAFHRGRTGPGGWWILIEPELHLDDDVCVPDLAGWRRERMPHIAENQTYFDLAPDWVCEVLSRSTERHDRAKKLRIYARAGVRYAWLVSPRARTLETYRNIDGHWSLIETYTDEERIRAEPFDAIELELAALWRDYKPPTHAAEGSAQHDFW